MASKVPVAAGLLKSRGKKVKFRGIFKDKFAEKTADFAGIFEASFTEKRLVKNGRFLWKLPEQILLESDWFCADLRKVFDETRRSYSIYSGFIPQYEIILYK